MQQTKKTSTQKIFTIQHTVFKNTYEILTTGRKATTDQSINTKCTCVYTIMLSFMSFRVCKNCENIKLHFFAIHINDANDTFNFKLRYENIPEDRLDFGQSLLYVQLLNSVYFFITNLTYSFCRRSKSTLTLLNPIKKRCAKLMSNVTSKLFIYLYPKMYTFSILYLNTFHSYNNYF